MAIIPADEKVFMVSKSTNTTYSGSASLKAMQEWYTMQDVSNTIKPYKVFTALLSQSGGDSPGEVDGDGGTIVEGVTYYINANPDNFDLTIYGAPNNDVGTYFIANQDATLPYNYTLQLYYNDGAPIATILENTIGNIWFAYNTPGTYFVNSTNLFINNKSMSIIGTPTDSVANKNFAGIVPFNASQFVIDVVEETLADGLLYKTPVEIRVYN